MGSRHFGYKTLVRRRIKHGRADKNARKLTEPAKDHLFEEQSIRQQVQADQYHIELLPQPVDGRHWLGSVGCMLLGSAMD